MVSHYDEKDMRNFYIIYNLITNVIWCVESLLDVREAEAGDKAAPQFKPMLIRTRLVLLLAVVFLAQSIYMLIRWKVRKFLTHAASTAILL